MPSDVAIIGSGIIGISVAWALMRQGKGQRITLIDCGPPMAFTSAQSGDNYRNWWPHPLMARFMDRSITLMEEIARAADNRIAMTRRGYVLATREAKADTMVAHLNAMLGDDRGQIRIQDGQAGTYQPPHSADWQAAPNGFDILTNPALIQATFPSLDQSIRTVLHVRRAGDISGQQLGQVMLEQLREAGLRRVTGKVVGISQRNGFTLSVEGREGLQLLRAPQIVNAAGPFAAEIAAMLGVILPLENVVQQKISLPDTARAIPRNLPFCIDLDGLDIDWTDEERMLLASDPDTAFLAAKMPGAIHCRPDGGDSGSWIKLGWAYNAAPAQVSWTPPLDPRFPEIVVRGASRLHPALRAYHKSLPRQMHHYGGFYTRTADNWPLIGPMGPEGAFMACGLSGHGTMAACATGELVAQWVAGTPSADWAIPFTMARFTDGAQFAVEESGLL